MPHGQFARVLLAMDTAIDEAAGILRRGGLVAFATETVYGLGADASNGAAVARIFEAKGRPRFNPLIVHVKNLEDAARYAIISREARALAEKFWPGPLTLVLVRREDAGLSDLVTSGLPTVALRCPEHETAQALIGAAGTPVAAPSANRSGRVSATMAKHVSADFGASIDLILDSGPCPAGLESTIVSFAGERARLLRPGAIPRQAIEEALGGPLYERERGVECQAPGSLESHYAPRAALRLNVREPKQGEAFLGFGPEAPEGACNLSPSGNLIEAASNLFAYMRKLDAGGAASIAVMPIPAHGLGEAINDRLRRAAAPRGDI